MQVDAILTNKIGERNCDKQNSTTTPMISTPWCYYHGYVILPGERDSVNVIQVTNQSIKIG